jgi:hypothetical protein
MMVSDLIFFRFSCQILHGVATFLVMAYFCEVGVPEIIVPMLLMEVSPYYSTNFDRWRFLPKSSLYLFLHLVAHKIIQKINTLNSIY